MWTIGPIHNAYSVNAHHSSKYCHAAKVKQPRYFDFKYLSWRLAKLHYPPPPIDHSLLLKFLFFKLLDKCFGLSCHLTFEVEQK